MKLAVCLWDRYQFNDGHVADRDRVIALLTPSTVDATVFDAESDDPFDTYARRQACLGLALADRSRDPEAGEDDRRADRMAAISLLQAAHDAVDPDDGLREMVVFDLARVRYVVHDWESDTSTADDLDDIIGLLAPFVADPDGTGAVAVDMCVILAQDLYRQDAGVARERSVIDWYRLAIGHPAVDEPELRGYRCDLGLVLKGRAERNLDEPAHDEPAPADDLAEALEQFELAFAATDLPLDPDETQAERDEERRSLQEALFDLLYPENLEVVEHDVLDRVIFLGDVLMSGILLEEGYRGELQLKLGFALHMRALRGIGPSIIPSTETLMRGGVPRPEIAMSATDPDSARDLDRAIELLRDGLGLYDYDDDFYMLGVQALGIALVVKFTMRQPLFDRPVLEEALRWQRIALDRLTPGTGIDVQAFRNIFIYTLMWSVWSNPPLAEGRTRAYDDKAIVFGISGYSSAEDELQLLGQLVDEAMAESEEDEDFYVLVAMNTTFLRDGDFPDNEKCRDWLRRLKRILSQLAGVRDFRRGIVQVYIGVIGMTLVIRGAADPLTMAEAFKEMSAARECFPEGHQMRSAIDDILEHGPSEIAKAANGMFGALLGAESATSHRDPVRDAAEPAETERGEGKQPKDPDYDEIDLAAAVFVGDGREYLFAEPPQRVLEIVDAAAVNLSAHPGRQPVAAALVGLARYDRWLRERNELDLGEAIRLVRAAAIGCEGVRPMLADRLEALFAGMLLDRYLLLGDRVDLETARSVQEALVRRTAPDAGHPDLINLLIQEGGTDGLPDVGGLFGVVPPVSRTFHAEMLAAAGSAGLLAAALDGPHGAPVMSDETVIATERLRQAVRLLPADHPRAPAARSELGWLNLQQARRSGDVATLRRAAVEVVAAATQCPSNHPHLPALLLHAASAAEIGESAAGPADTSLVDEVVEHLAAAVAHPGRGYYGERSRCQYGLGRLLLGRFHRQGNREDRDGAIAALESARFALSASPGDPFAVILLRTLALAYRACGPWDPDRRRRSRDTGRSILSAHGRAVLLQSGTHRGLGVARRAGEDMLRLVRWCLADGQLTAALDALELGRGLALQAATVAATVPRLLREAGYDGLADEWVHFTAPSPGWGSEAESDGMDAWHEVPDDLRRRVLEALEGTTAERRLLSAPSPADVGRALTGLGADALVHLVPGTSTVPGHALIVTASGEVEQLSLRGLMRRPGDVLDTYLESFDRHEAAKRAPGRAVGAEAVKERDATTKTRWRGQVDRLCAWAGQAVMTELLDHARSWRLDRDPRLVLAPIGPLGVVPWHAAHVREPSGTSRTGITHSGTRVACQDAVISYCATSRQLIDAAARPRLPLSGVQVLLVDPHGSPVMQEEAARIRSNFYPASVVVGDIAWTPEDGVAWTGPDQLSAVAANVEPYLPGRGPTSAAVFVANCHAVSGAVSSDSRLVLDQEHAKDPDCLVTVDRLLSGTVARNPEAPGGLFLLANCSSDLAIADYDEAVTITTAVLAAGAASVVGSRWPVADDLRTMVLMYMFHHFLAGRGDAEACGAAGSPADALRAAQLWMLDPQRVPPPEIVDVFTRLSGSALDDPEIWAAFTHHGH